MAERYNFKYLPLVGKLPGKSMVEQTEAAVNELASVVYDNVGYAGNLAKEVQTANTNASNALEKATEALETSSRVYIKQIAAVDVNDYYNSELYYINNDGSTNIPIRDTGFLEVKTNDDKTACEQVFIADSTGTPYYRHGVITEQTLGEETTYVVTWGSWYQGATAEYVQAELEDYLALTGGAITGNLSVSGTITGDLVGNADTATNATNDGNGNEISTTYLPLSGGTMTGNISYNGSNSEKFSLGLSSTTNIDIGWNFANEDGALLALRGNSDNNSGNFELFARNTSNSASLVGTPNGNLKWKGWNIPAGYLGDAPNNTAKTFTLPASGTYLIMTAHNSTPGLNSIFMVSLGSGAFKMVGGSNITMKTSDRNITVTATSGAVRVYYIILNTVS